MKTVRGVLCVLALVPVAAVATGMPAGTHSSDARCAAHQAEAHLAAERARIMRAAARSESVPRTGEFRPTASHAWAASSLASARDGLAPFTCAPKKGSADAANQPHVNRSVRKIGPR